MKYSTLAKRDSKGESRDKYILVEVGEEVRRMKMSGMDWVVWVLLFVGGLNWGLVGAFGFDLVAQIFGGSDNIIARIIYILVGLAAIWSLISVFSKSSSTSTATMPQ